MLAVHHPSVSSSTIRPRDALLVLEPVQRHSGLEPLILLPGQCTLGSAEDCTLPLRAQGVRPRHCTIITDRKHSLLRALDAETWLNESRLREALLSPGDRLSIGPVQLRVREATLHERLEIRTRSAAATEAEIRRDDRPAAPVDASEIQQLREELERRLNVLRTDLGTQQQKLTEALDRQNASVVEVAQQQREANEADGRIEHARRKEALISDLLRTLQAHADRLRKREQQHAAEQRRRHDQLSRRQNETSIEAALFRSRKRRLDRRECELEGRQAKLQQQREQWQDFKRRTEQVLSQLHREASERQDDLEHKRAEVDHRREQLRVQETEVSQRQAAIEQQAEQLTLQSQRCNEEHNARKAAIAVRLDGMAHWEAAIAQRDRDLDGRDQQLRAGESELNQHRQDLRRRQNRLGDAVDAQLCSQSELIDRQRELETRGQQLQQQSAELADRAATLDEERRVIDHQLAELTAILTGATGAATPNAARTTTGGARPDGSGPPGTESRAGHLERRAGGNDRLTGATGAAAPNAA